MILVTGAAGKTGLAVLCALAAAGAETRAFVRKEEYRDWAAGAGASEVVVGDLEHPGDVRAALDGADALYLILPNMAPHEEHMGKRIIRQAIAARLPRLVYHSVLLPDVESMPHHWQKYQVELSLQQSDLDYSILQPAAYMQNILGYWEAIQSQGLYQLPYSVDAPASPVDLKDVAAAAAKVLIEEGHYGATYELCGPESLSARDQAALVGQHLGREIRVEAISIDEWQAAARGQPAYARDTLAAMFRYYDQYGLTGGPWMLQKLLGRPPTTFAQFLGRLPK